MPSFETLDLIADTYVPLLAITWLALTLTPLLSRHWRLCAARAALGLATLIAAYGLMAIDAALQLWPRFGLDYSTHTAVALALVVTITAASRRIGLVAAALFSLYVPLMLYQRYHSFADIATTALAVGVPIVAAVLALRRFLRPAPSRAALTVSFRPRSLGDAV